ncbi:MAG: hypothetical protein AAFQ36_07340 [Pseudomonadota bacterium]
MFVALLGVLMGTAVFAGFFFSVAQIFRQSGWLSRVHVALAGLVVVGMACISLGWPVVATATGILLMIAGIAGMILEVRWNRLLPIPQIFFGVALGMGLPFG